MRRLLHGLTVAAAVLATVIVVPAEAAVSRDGPGTYVVVRTYPQTAGPTAEQDAACERYFGPQRSSTVALRQSAVQFASRVDATGLAVDEDASFAGGGYICGAPGVSPDLTEVFAIADVPAGRATMHGPCQVSLLQWLRAAPFLGCRLAIDPMPGVSAVGGHAVSNTVAGSIFVGYLVRDPAKPLPYAAPPAEPAWQELPNDPDFYLWRTFDATAGACPEAALSATHPDLQSTALDPRERVRKTGELTLCHLGAGKAQATVTFQRAGTTANLTASGDCRTEPTPAGPQLRVQTCVLDVVWADSPLFRAGQLTSIGLVRADNPQLAANSHIWTLGVLDGQTGAA